MQGFYKTLNCTHIFNHTRIYNCYSICVYLGLSIILPFLLLFVPFYISVLPSGIMKNLLCISFTIDLVVNNSVNFGVPIYVFIWPSFFKESFVGYRILDCLLFSVNN